MKKLFIVLFSLCLVLSVFLTLIILKPGAQSVKVVPHNLNNPLYESYLKTENGFSYISVSKNEKDLNNVKEKSREPFLMSPTTKKAYRKLF